MDPIIDPFTPLPLASTPFANLRRAARIGFELLVRCKHGLVRSTVMLHDLTRFGARIDGLRAPLEGEAISLMLPGEAPRLAFVMWARGSAAGLEFADPLAPDLFDALIRDYAIGNQPPPQPSAPRSPLRAAA
jgi:hypothetical protein